MSEGAGFVEADITLSEASAQVVTVIARGSSYGSVDYDSSDKVITFQPGQTVARYKTAIYEDSLYEGDEFFSINLASATNAVIDLGSSGVRTLYGYITDNDAPLAVAPPLPTVRLTAPADLVEGQDTGFNLGLVFGNVSTLTSTVTLTFNTTSSATNGLDVSIPASSYSFSVSQNPVRDYAFDLGRFSIFDDAIAEGTETISLTVRASGQVFSSGTDTITVSIPLYDTDASNRDDVIVGGNGADRLNGLAGNDIINARGGNDTIIGSVGFDRIDGGSGVDIFSSGTLARARTTNISDGAGRVGDSTIANIEYVTFRDGTVTFDQDGAAAQIYRLYDSAFGRKPDYFGGQGWIDALNSGTSLVSVANLFVASSEFQARTAGLSNGDLVDYIYNFTLHRAADPGGRANWIDYLDSGRSVAELLVGFSESAEHRTNTASAVQAGLWDGNKAFETVEFMYDATFGRLPDQGGLLGWASFIEGGATVRDLAGLFVQSDEYRANTASLTNGQLVDYTYNVALGRSADPGGRENWVAYLNAGNPVADLITGFVLSAELMNNNISSIDHGIAFI